MTDVIPVHPAIVLARERKGSCVKVDVILGRRARVHERESTRRSVEFSNADSAGDVSLSMVGQVSTILAVDDTKAMRDFVQFTLSGFEGIAVEEAGDGATALRMLHQRRFDLLLTDLFLPGVDGMQLLVFMRRQGLNQSTPAIMMTGDARPQTRAHALKLGAQDVLIKPFHCEGLIEATRAALELPKIADPGGGLRRAPRIRLPVEIEIPGDPVLICSTWDLSPYGAFVTCESPPLWTRVTLKLLLPAGPIAVGAEIVHTRPRPVGPLPAGFGCKFNENPDVIRKILAALVSPEDEEL